MWRVLALIWFVDDVIGLVHVLASVEIYPMTFYLGAPLVPASTGRVVAQAQIKLPLLLILQFKTKKGKKRETEYMWLRK